ncbi:MAG: iron-containing alcohol dehydrogenase [Burkholderiales bacterium]|nr:iron-containing alcohol dehydrogenase [Burkholderiales bacterium]
MKDFVFYNPTKVYFGPDQLPNLPKEILKYGSKVLLVYGGGSIKRIGLYDKIVKLAKDNNITLFELSGVEPNPMYTTVNKGVDICAKEKIDVLLAVGGGSSIDCAKGIAAAAKDESKDVWQIIKRGKEIDEALPIIAIPTTAATGSETDPMAVISNRDTEEKLLLSGPALYPRAAFENPENSYSLPSFQTACGSVDIFNHVVDKYYIVSGSTFDVVRGLQEAVMMAAVKWAPIAVKEPRNYEARANLQWAASLALDGILDGGTYHQTSCHPMEHQLSAYYDITHGLGLAILMPRWLTYILDDHTAPQIYRLGEKVFGVPSGLDTMQGAKEAIDAVANWCYVTLGLKSSLSALGIDGKHFDEMAKKACGGGYIDGPRKLYPEDVKKIYEMSLQEWQKVPVNS